MESPKYSRWPAPPRPVPFGVKLQLLLGGIISQIGWGIFGFGLLFVWIFALNADFTSSFVFREPEVRVTQGVVTDSRETNAEINDREVYAMEFSFQAMGKEFTSVSYLTGQEIPEGQWVPVEYLRNDPAVARIQGARRAVFGPEVLFVVLFPLIGWVMLLTGLGRGLQAQRLLSHGLLAWGKQVAQTATSAHINRQTIYKLTYEFKDTKGQSHQVVCSTHLTDRLQKEHEPLLYAPLRPSRVIFLNVLPGGPLTFDSHGQIANRLKVGLLILPGIALAILVAIAQSLR